MRDLKTPYYGEFVGYDTMGIPYIVRREERRRKKEGCRKPNLIGAVATREFEHFSARREAACAASLIMTIYII